MSEHNAPPPLVSYSADASPRVELAERDEVERPASSSPVLVPRRLVWMCRAGALLLGAIQAWAFRYEATPDGVSYLDVADAVREGRWADAPNGYWSPLYPALLALVGAILRLPRTADFILTHVANYVAYILALLAFEFFLRGIPRVREGSSDRRRDWWVLGYALFLWATLGLIGLGFPTPDMLLAGAAFMVAGVLVRVSPAGRARTQGVTLGTAAGIGYLAKAVFFPLFFIFLPVAGIMWWRARRTLVPTILAALCFAAVALPYAAALSRTEGKMTFGESGRLAYAWIVNNVHGQVHWQGGPPAVGVPRHPTRQISITPEAYEFATPFRVTYPPWYAPSYWYDGVRARFAPASQIRIAFRYLPMLLELLGPLLLIAGATTIAARPRWAAGAAALKRGWWLIVPSSAAILMYSSLFLEGRYVAPFLVMLWCGTLLVIEPFMSRRWRRGLFGAAAALTVLGTLPRLAPTVRALLPAYSDEHGQDAAFILRDGLRSGDAVAILGDGVYAYWARLAGLHIVAEVPSRATPDFWTGDPADQRFLLDKFRQAGAVAVVTRGVPGRATLPRWQTQEDGDLSMLRLSDPGDREAP